jgi:hypothetical protein
LEKQPHQPDAPVHPARQQHDLERVLQDDGQQDEPAEYCQNWYFGTYRGACTATGPEMRQNSLVRNRRRIRAYRQFLGDGGPPRTDIPGGRGVW